MEPKKISGKLRIDPLPCAVFGKKLIIRPIPHPNSTPARKRDKNQYRLEFTAISDDTKNNFSFLLYAFRNPDKINREQESLVASLDIKFRKEKRPQKITLECQLPEGFFRGNNGLSLFIQESNNPPLDCKSLWLKTGERCWIVFEKTRISKIQLCRHGIK